MKFSPLLAVVVFFVAGPFGIIEAYSPFGGYNRALLGNVWVRADNRARTGGGSTVDDEVNEERMTGAKRPAGSPVFHSALSYGKRADGDDSNNFERRAYHSGITFGKRTARDRRGFHSAMPFGKRDAEESEEQAAAVERRGYNSALMFGKRVHSALPFGKRAYHSGLPFGKRLSADEDEGMVVNRRGFHTGLPFGKRDENTEAVVSDILSQLRREE